MDKHSHAGSPFAHLASFPMTSRWSKEAESGERRSVGVLLIICGGCELPFIQVIVPSGPLLWDRGFTVESREEVLPFQVATKYVACINLPTSQPVRSFFLFLTPLWFPPSTPHPCGLFSPLGADVWNGQYFVFRSCLFIY